tara:strand:- start:321 stop:620 length:300 start_codon:yes stop_codon:yes gene_type:complete
MPKDTIDEFFDELNAELLKPEYQAELKEVITKSPEAYRKVVEQQEKGLEFTDDESATNAVLNRVNKRMMTESPALMSQRLRVTTDGIIADVVAHRRELE